MKKVKGDGKKGEGSGMRIQMPYSKVMILDQTKKMAFQ
jgi:hypothetical protein